MKAALCLLRVHKPTVFCLAFWLLQCFLFVSLPRSVTAQNQNEIASSLRINYSNCSNNGREGLVLQFSLNETVDLPQLKEHVKIEPPIENMKIISTSQDYFSISGAFIGRHGYTLKITPGLKDKGGKVLQKEISHPFQTEEISSYLNFDQDGKYYFPRRGGVVPLNIESRNIKAANVRLMRLFPSNIAAALDQVTRDQRNDGEYDYEYESRSSGSFDDWSELVFEKKVPLTFKLDQLAQTPLELAKFLPSDSKGVYCLDAKEAKEDKSDGYRSSSKILLLTNLGLLAHWQSTELVVFVHDLYTLQPVSGASVTVYSSKNQLLGEGRTDSSGIAHLTGFKKSLGDPKVVVVENGKDYSFLELKARQEEGSVDNPEAPESYGDRYDAFIYADRDLYRPGETVHFRWIVRRNFGDVVAGVPFKFEVTKPNGKSLVSQVVNLSDLGTGGFDLETGKGYPTGLYQAYLRVPGDETAIGNYELHVEEFVPARMKVAVKVDAERLVAGKDYKIEVNGQHLFGAPATDRNSSAYIVPLSGGFTSEKWKGFRFGNETKPDLDKISLGDETTGADGTATFTFNWSPQASATYPMEANVVGNVFELAGRGVSGSQKVLLFPSAIALGISAVPASAGRDIDFSAAAINADETPTSLSQVTITVERQVWNYYVRRYYSHNEPNWNYTYQEIEKKTVDLKEGRGTARFTVPGYGYFRARINSPATQQFSTMTFYCYGDRCDIVDPSRPSLVKLTPDKESYQIGDMARIRIESPFNGKGFIVLQTDKLQEISPIEVTNHVGEAKFKIRPEHFPCIWFEATVVHSIKEEPMLVSPFSSFGMTHLTVDNPKRKLQVCFPTLPVETKPATDLDVVVKIQNEAGKPVRNAELTLAAVDEGIHLVSGYKNPDPYQWLTRLRQPKMSRNHYYDKVAFQSKETAPGGDEAQMAKRAGEGLDNWIKPVAMWSGAVKTDKNGIAHIPFSLPEFNGQIRLVAVACNAEAVGSGSASLFVRRPYMLQTTQPRFLLPGDQFVSRAALYNTSDTSCTAIVDWVTSGALKAVKDSKTVKLGPKGEANVAANLAAADSVGPGAILWEVVFQDLKGAELARLKENIALPVNVPASFQSKQEMILLRSGEKRTVGNTFFLDNDAAEVDVTVGSDIFLRLQNALGYVTGYPYGCVEQTTSKLFPTYLLRRSKGLIDAGAIKSDDSNSPTRKELLEAYVQSGIQRLFSMQTAEGGLAFWPGGSEAYPYGSIYALHCLTVIRNDREVAVPDENFKALQGYVSKIARDWFHESDSAVFQRAYAVYVLALGNNIEGIQQISRFDTVAVPRSARYLLAAALAISTKDAERVKKYLATAPTKKYDNIEYCGTLNSPLRNEAIELLAMKQMDLPKEELAQKANTLILYLDKYNHGNTQETSFILTALSGYLKAVSGDISMTSATVVAPGGASSPVTADKTFHGTHRGKGGDYTITNTGKMDLFVNLTTRGIPMQPDLKLVAKGITIERIYHIDDTAWTSATAINQTQSCVVQLRITAPTTLENLIVVDMLPAGLEIENPRLNPDRIPQMNLGASASPSHLELRDDRLVLAFDTLYRGTHDYYYITRAVTPGKFQHPGATAECMYDASVMGRSVPASVEVK